MSTITERISSKGKPQFLSIVAALVLVGGSSLSAEEKYPKPPKDETTHKFAYRGVVEVGGVDADTLYGRAMAWVATTYRSANEVIQLDDPYAGRIIAKGNFSFTAHGSQKSVNHTLTIEVKDGRYRYALTDFVISYAGLHEVPLEDERSLTGIRKKSFDTVVSRSQEAITGLEVAMAVVEEEW